MTITETKNKIADLTEKMNDYAGKADEMKAHGCFESAGAFESWAERLSEQVDELKKSLAEMEMKNADGLRQTIALQHLKTVTRKIGTRENASDYLLECILHSITHLTNHGGSVKGVKKRDADTLYQRIIGKIDALYHISQNEDGCMDRHLDLCIRADNALNTAYKNL